MTTRETVHELVDRLPEGALPSAEDALRALTPAPQDDDFLAWLNSLPEEDEELSPRELEAIENWRKNPRPGIRLTWEELERLVFGPHQPA